MQGNALPFLIAVHAGLRQACQAGAAALRAGRSAPDAVAAAIAVLEDSEVCNAGHGSNLSFEGVVECDASVMEGDGTFGAVGAVSGVRNPVRVAHRLAGEQRQPLSHGRVRPMMLAGDKARTWALSRGIPAADTAEEAEQPHADDSIDGEYGLPFLLQWSVSESARRRWRKYRRMVDGSGGSGMGPSLEAGLPAAGAPAAAAPPAAEVAAAAAATGGLPAKAAGHQATEGPAESEKPRLGPHQVQRVQHGTRTGRQVTSRTPGSVQPWRDHNKLQQQEREEQGQQQQQQQEEEQGQQQRGGQQVAAKRGRHEGPCMDPGGGRGSSSGGDSSEGGSEGGSQLYDTVGCVVVDASGHVVAGVSSGGIALKAEGRVGEAAVYGAGCWAQDSKDSRPGVACSVTGVGERIIQHLVARECAMRVIAAASAEQEVEGSEASTSASAACAAVLRETILQGPPPRDCGVLCVKVLITTDQSNGTTTGLIEQAAPTDGLAQQSFSADTLHCPGSLVGSAPAMEAASRATLAAAASADVASEVSRLEVELSVAHCASSMAVGYLTHSMTNPSVTFLRRESAAAPADRQREKQRHWAGSQQAQRVDEAAAAAQELMAFSFGVHWSLRHEDV
ncbi:hypothetical protein N2152v2_005669 [Parachlorella kessleri]